MATEHAHLALAVDVINPRDVGQGEHAETPDNPDYPWHFLAEGDSWFTIAAIPSSNLLLELRLGRWTQILNLAYPGDTLRNIETLVSNKDLTRFLAKKNFCSHFDALLLSGGGNDLINGVGELIRTEPRARRRSGAAGELRRRAGVRRPAAEGAGGVRDHRRGARLGHSLSRGSPAFVHTYDYATPRDAPARFVGAVPIAGPWLFKAFAGSGIDISLQQRIADLLTDGLADALLGARLGQRRERQGAAGVPRHRHPRHPGARQPDRTRQQQRLDQRDPSQPRRLPQDRGPPLGQDQRGAAGLSGRQRSAAQSRAGGSRAARPARRARR